MTILLLGSTGRLGGAFTRMLTDVTFVCPTQEELDLSNKAAVEAYVTAHPHINWVVNTAAYNNVDGCETDPVEATKAELLNITIPGVLAEVAKTHNLPFLHISTDYVFDGTKPEGYVETDPVNPVSVYGKTKAEGERAVLATHPGAYVVRTSRLYGKNGVSANAKRSFVEIILAEATKGDFASNPVEVSSPTWVDDLVEHLFIHIIVSKPAPGIYHMSNAGGATWFEWAKAIVELRGLPVTVRPRSPEEIPTRPAKRPAFSILLSTKLPQMRPWKEALRDFLNTSSL